LYISGKKQNCWELIKNCILQNYNPGITIILVGMTIKEKDTDIPLYLSSNENDAK